MADRAAWTRYAGVALELREPRSKYRAIPQELEGIRFASRKEALRYLELRMLERAGAIRDLELQPRWRLEVVALEAAALGEVITCGRYTADFRYLDVITGELVIEDVKSKATRTTAYRLRKRLVEAIYRIRILEV